MYLAIITRGIFIVNVVCTVLQDILFPLGQTKMLVTAIDEPVVCYIVKTLNMSSIFCKYERLSFNIKTMYCKNYIMKNRCTLYKA